MDFRATNYGSEAARILDMAGSGLRSMDLTSSHCISEEGRRSLQGVQAETLFPNGRDPKAALSGLYLYLGCFHEAHAIAQDLDSPEGSYWHGILHRLEPDPGNAKYWFKKVGDHPLYPRLCAEARTYAYDAGDNWDPATFVDFCESAARRPGSDEEGVAKTIQLIEWQLLFDWCAS